MLLPCWTRAPLTALVLCLSLLAAGEARAQEPYRIQGTVVDATTQRPIPGAQVMIRGTQLGSLTNSAGAYLIVARLSPGEYTLNVTFIGRESASRQIQLGATPLVEVPAIALAERALALDAIVVTGQAAPTSVRAMGTSVSTVDARQLEDTPALTIDQALQGKVAGALITSNVGQPGGGVSIRLRGTSSIIGGAEPLFIVDGVIIDNNAEQQINVGYRSNPINRLADLNPEDIERVEILKGAAAAALYGSRANNGVVQIFTKRGRAGETLVTASSRMSRSDLPRRIPFAMTPVDVTIAGGLVTGVTPNVQRFDNQELIFRDAWGTDNHVSVAGGTGGTRYFLSASYADQDGIMIGSAHDKLNARLNLDQAFGERFSISAGANYIRSNTSLVVSGEQGEGGLLTSVVFTPTTVDFSAIRPETGDYVTQATTFPNPLVVVRDWELPQIVSRFVGSMQARANPVSDVTLEYRLGYDTYQMETRQSIPTGSPWLPEGRAMSINRGNMLINNDVVGSGLWSVGGLQMTTSLGMNHTYQRVEQLNASARDVTPVTRLVRGAVQTATQAHTELATIGFFAQQQVAVAERLYLTGAVRFDASSTFGADERWQSYPKVSASYVLSDEPFYRNSPLAGWVGEFRLRGALGYAGNQPPLAHAYSRLDRYGADANVNRQGLIPLAALGNPELRPERQREIEAGFDLSTLQDRVGLSFTWYDQVTEDLLLTRPFAPSTGVNTRLENVGQLSNWGLELQLNTINVDRPAFRWSTTAIYSQNRNRVDRLVVDPFLSGYTNWVTEGQPLGVHRMWGYARDAQGNIQFDAAGLPVRSAAADVIVGSPWPDYTASLRNEFRIGASWTASFLLDGQFGHKIWNQTRRIQDLFGAGPLFDEVLQACAAGVGEQCAQAQARRVRTQNIWEAYLEDGSFIKLRDVALRYSIPSRFAQRVGLSGLQLELMGRNLYTWTDYTGYDPEINMFGLSTVERGTDFAVYPNAREVSLGIRLNY